MKTQSSIKQKFFADLQHALVKIPPMISYIVVLGDFNARVGVLDEEGSLW